MEFDMNNPLSELLNEIIILENDTRKKDPYPEGAIIGVDTLMEFVNNNQKPTPSEWRTMDYYKSDNLAKDCEYLRTLELPQTGATLFIVHVPTNSKHSYIAEYHVPPFEELIHNPEFIEFKKDTMKREFVSWRENSLYNETLQYGIKYLHIDTIGIDPIRRSNAWMTFSNREDAEVYLRQMITADIKPSAVLLAFAKILEEFSDEVLEEQLRMMDPDFE